MTSSATKKLTLSLARERADARLYAVDSSPAGGVAKVSSQNEWRLRWCPDAILVRAVETLGRVFMHREAALVGDARARRGEEEMPEWKGGRTRLMLALDV